MNITTIIFLIALFLYISSFWLQTKLVEVEDIIECEDTNGNKIIDSKCRYIHYQSGFNLYLFYFSGAIGLVGTFGIGGGYLLNRLIEKME